MLLISQAPVTVTLARGASGRCLCKIIGRTLSLILFQKIISHKTKMLEQGHLTFSPGGYYPPLHPRHGHFSAKCLKEEMFNMSA